MSRVVVTIEALELALARWHRDRLAGEARLSRDQVEEQRRHVYMQDSLAWGRDLAPYVFELLQKFGEPTR